MKKSTVGKILIFIGISFFVLYLIIIVVALTFLNSNLRYFLLAINGSGFILTITVPIAFFIFIFTGSLLINSVAKTSIGKIFIVEKIDKKGNKGIIKFQGLELTVISPDSLNVGDHVKITGTETIVSGRNRSTVYLCKKIEENDPEYFNVEGANTNKIY